MNQVKDLFFNVAQTILIIFSFLVIYRLWSSGWSIFLVVPFVAISSTILVHAIQAFINKWEFFYDWAKWLLILPIFIFIAGLVSFSTIFVLDVFGLEKGIFRNAFMLLNSGVNMFILFWCVFGLSPKFKKTIAGCLFILVIMYLSYSTLKLARGENIFGTYVETSLVSYWILQNVVWIVTATASILYLSSDKSINGSFTSNS